MTKTAANLPYTLSQVNGADLKPGDVIFNQGYAWEVISVNRNLGNSPAVDRYSVLARWVDLDGRGNPGNGYNDPAGISFGLRVDMTWTRRDPK